MSSKPLYAPPPAPVSKLARYRTLSPLAGVRVSPLCFGALGIGDKWQRSMDKETSFKLLDAYFDLGMGLLREFIGEWAEKRGVRDQLVIATKYTGDYKRGQDDITHKVNYTGNHAKSLHISVHESLRKLRTSYIDILYVHWWDYNTSVEEVMNSLHILVLQTKVLYLGISDAPAWVVSKANQYARDLGKTSIKRDIIPMARSEGLALAPWGILGGGRIRTDTEEARRRESGEKGRLFFHSNWERTEEERKMSLVLEEVAQEVGVEGITADAVCIPHHRLPQGRAFAGEPEGLDITLTPEQTQRIEDATTFEIGFPFKTFVPRELAQLLSVSRRPLIQTKYLYRKLSDRRKIESPGGDLSRVQMHRDENSRSIRVDIFRRQEYSESISGNEERHMCTKGCACVPTRIGWLREEYKGNESSEDRLYDNNLPYSPSRRAMIVLKPYALDSEV
ncbi:NADP-dependent oxidoreductase domain-containing protein [Lactarius hatsudake]|nr:NADP-dependent oxidoreductase domain-containing protein [Lactarius hatsudake]